MPCSMPAKATSAPNVETTILVALWAPAFSCTAALRVAAASVACMTSSLA